ncbi:unnamed protein product [Plasmodium vivax]|uniref:(malaria parasite P. vivax) hypothetical protein n=1 Tax=Plasmodium vivax TaxID=5855 RepID=A0A8S4HKL0_PLAVI|nr:unnamed protein product [Plasmodium vivax]
MPRPPSSKNFSHLFSISDKDLISDKFYDAMDTEFLILYSYENICKEKLISKKTLEMTPICVKYLRFLDDSELWSDSSFEYDVSILLNYWLYDKIAAIYGITDIATISIDFSALQMVWDHFMESRKRKPYNEKFKPNTDIFYEEDWEKRRKLYEYYVNYDTLFKTAELFPEKCEEYYQKIKEMFPVCTFFEGKCSKSGTYKCPNNLNKCKEKNLESELKKFQCHRTIKSRSDSNSEDDTSQQPPRPVEGPLVTTGGPTAESNTQLESENFEIGKKVSHTVLGAAPVLLTATMLYRVCIYYINIYHYSMNL